MEVFELEIKGTKLIAKETGQEIEAEAIGVPYTEKFVPGYDPIKEVRKDIYRNEKLPIELEKDNYPTLVGLVMGTMIKIRDKDMFEEEAALGDIVYVSSFQFYKINEETPESALI